MPLNIPENLPAYKTLEEENIFIISENIASKQDIRPLEIAILNLMPTKMETETQLLRLLSNTPLQVNPHFIKTESYQQKHDKLHIDKFYKPFPELKNSLFDALIITGAPVETLDFNDIKYKEELWDILEWSKTNVFSTLHICWGAMVGLYYHYGLQKINLEHKLSGVFTHTVLEPLSPLLKGFDDEFLIPHSRNAETPRDLIKGCNKLTLIADSSESGAAIVTAEKGRLIFVSGHFEYDKDTLKNEYERDVMRGLNPKIPENYFPLNSPTNHPKKTWTAHASLFYYNWLNYVYQETPYNLSQLEPITE